MTDRWTLAYFYKLPPMYNDELTKSMLRIISFVPIFSLSILFWQSTNKQMFDNKIDKIKTEGDVRPSYHKISEIKWSQLNNA